jgi:hypothetical protein
MNIVDLITVGNSQSRIGVCRVLSGLGSHRNFVSPEGLEKFVRVFRMVLETSTCEEEYAQTVKCISDCDGNGPEYVDICMRFGIFDRMFDRIDEETSFSVKVAVFNCLFGFFVNGNRASRDGLIERGLFRIVDVYGLCVVRQCGLSMVELFREVWSLGDAELIETCERIEVLRSLAEHEDSEVRNTSAMILADINERENWCDAGLVLEGDDDGIPV